MTESDRIRLQHMLDAAREALSFAEGRTRVDLNHDRMLALSLTAEIQIIGEAASRVSPEIKQSVSSIPWGEIIGMRNRLIHVYTEINLDILWDTVRREPEPITVKRTASVTPRAVPGRVKTGAIAP
jgi:uncharacterized protein with HEPN domain